MTLRIAIVFCLLMIKPSFGRAFDLAEIDGDDQAGNSLCLLGWNPEKSPQPLPVVIVRPEGSPILDDLPEEGRVEAIVRRSFQTWEDVPTSWFRFDLKQDGSPYLVGGVLTLSADRGISATGITPFNDSLSKAPLPDSDGNHNCVAFVERGWNEAPPPGPDEAPRPGPYGFGFSRNALAITLYAFSAQSRHITGMDLLVNGEHFDNARLGSTTDLDTGLHQDPSLWGWADLPDDYVPDPATTPAPLLNPPYQDLGNTLVHEIGHALGLSHADPLLRPESTMLASAAGGETKKRSLDRDDVNGVTFLYPMADAVIVAPDHNGPGVPDPRSISAKGGCSGGGAPALDLLLIVALLTCLWWEGLQGGRNQPSSDAGR